MAQKLPEKTPNKNQANPIKEFIPYRDSDIQTDTKFVQFLNIGNIEKLYQRVNLIDLTKVTDKDYYYIKGCLDSLYALIGVDTPLKKVLDKEIHDYADDRLLTYIRSITSKLDSSRITRKITKEEKKKNASSQEQLLHHIFNITDDDEIYPDEQYGEEQSN